jgi:ribosomal protein S18 acetylase RimI-like enzyme
VSEGVVMRPMRADDLDVVSRIYASHVGSAPVESFSARVRRLFEEPATSVALVAEVGEAVAGYVVGEVRSWEFGSEPAGWIFGVSVAPEHEGRGIARSLLASAVDQLLARGARTVRTMVSNDDVPVLRLFRNAGFVAGPYTQLELGPEDER